MKLEKPIISILQPPTRHYGSYSYRKWNTSATNNQISCNFLTETCITKPMFTNALDIDNLQREKIAKYKKVE